MDDCWERSIPIYSLTKESLGKIFDEFNKSKVLDYKSISIGCRNSNYMVLTSEGKFLLRICVGLSKNEEVISRALDDYIHVPKLLYSGTINRKEYLIYEYIESISMQSLLKKGSLDDKLIKQVAKTAALIHQVDKKRLCGFVEAEYPPFSTWYNLFLDNHYVIERLGNKIVDSVKTLVKHSENQLKKIDSYQSFIHSDFRPANMLVDNKQRVYIVDWEYCGFGHSLGDIGQFFRYQGLFNDHQIKLFECEYNRYAKVKLPKDWYDLAKLRDLINPLQMLGGKNDLPLKYNDLKEIILDTLTYFKEREMI
ncbi:phosphotransferase [Mycoplasmatota bacterium]|nr:phosphotransferase [Mycoplasmatota bacterium]